MVPIQQIFVLNELKIRPCDAQHVDPLVPHLINPFTATLGRPLTPHKLQFINRRWFPTANVSANRRQIVSVAVTIAFQ